MDKTLYLGAGKQERKENSVTVDMRSEGKPDIVHDLNIFPWPLESDSFSEIICQDVIEHLNDLVKVMEEIHRVGKAGAVIRITTPHYSSHNSYTDPTHKQHLGLFSFDYFTGANQWDFYTKVRFQKKKADLYFYPGWINKVIWRIAKRWPLFYEKRLAWIFPAWFMSFDLIIVK